MRHGSTWGLADMAIEVELKYSTAVHVEPVVARCASQYISLDIAQEDGKNEPLHWCISIRC